MPAVDLLLRLLGLPLCLEGLPQVHRLSVGVDRLIPELVQPLKRLQILLDLRHPLVDLCLDGLDAHRRVEPLLAPDPSRVHVVGEREGVQVGQDLLPLLLLLELLAPLDLRVDDRHRLVDDPDHLVDLRLELREGLHVFLLEADPLVVQRLLQLVEVRPVGLRLFDRLVGVDQGLIVLHPFGDLCLELLIVPLDPLRDRNLRHFKSHSFRALLHLFMKASSASTRNSTA